MPQGLRGGTETFWQTWGEGAPEALLIHCTLAHSGAWRGFAPMLGKPSVGFDLPAHGRSGPKDPERDWHDQCIDIAESFLGDAPVDLIGHSFGGTVALRLAVENPERVRRLVLIEPVYFRAAAETKTYAEHLEEVAPFVQLIEDAKFAEAAQWFTARWGGGADWDALDDTRRARLEQQIQMVPKQDQAIFHDRPGVFDEGRLETLDIPVMLMRGSMTMPIIGAIHQGIVARLPNASDVILPGAGHMLPISHAKEAAARVSAFLQRPAKT